MCHNQNKRQGKEGGWLLYKDEYEHWTRMYSICNLFFLTWVCIVPCTVTDSRTAWAEVSGGREDRVITTTTTDHWSRAGCVPLLPRVPSKALYPTQPRCCKTTNGGKKRRKCIYKKALNSSWQIMLQGSVTRKKEVKVTHYSTKHKKFVGVGGREGGQTWRFS